MLAGASPCRLTAQGVRLTVRVTPNAGVDRIEGVEMRADGQCALRLRVAAVPDKGKANAAVVGLIAGALERPKSAISIVSGDTARLKILEITGDRADLARRIEILCG